MTQLQASLFNFVLKTVKYMGISQKVRSLHCGFQQGLGLEVIAGESVMLLKNVPFELEDIIARWIIALPTELTNGPTSLVKLYPAEGLALTESGWSAFVSWMTETLSNAQYDLDFPQKVQLATKNSLE